MSTFSVTDVRAVFVGGQADALANGDFWLPYQGISSETEARAGLRLVGDEGVYLTSSGRFAEGQFPILIYVEECDPKINPDYWHYKHQHFGGDDGVEFLDTVEFDQLIAAAPDATHLRITMHDTSLSNDLTSP